MGHPVFITQRMRKLAKPSARSAHSFCCGIHYENCIAAPCQIKQHPFPAKLCWAGLHAYFSKATMTKTMTTGAKDSSFSPRSRWTSAAGWRPWMSRHWGWVVVGVSMFSYMALYGTILSYGVLFLEFQAEFGSSATFTGCVGSIPFALSILLAPVNNLLLHYFSHRVVALASLLLAVIGLIATTFVPNIVGAFFTYGLGLGSGAGMFLLVGMNLVAQYFPSDNCFRATGIALIGFNLGLLSFAPLITRLSKIYGWRNTLRIIGVIICAIGFPSVFTYTPPSPSTVLDDQDPCKMDVYGTIYDEDSDNRCRAVELDDLDPEKGDGGESASFLVEELAVREGKLDETVITESDQGRYMNDASYNDTSLNRDGRTHANEINKRIYVKLDDDTDSDFVGSTNVEHIQCSAAHQATQEQRGTPGISDIARKQRTDSDDILQISVDNVIANIKIQDEDASSGKRSSKDVILQMQERQNSDNEMTDELLRSQRVEAERGTLAKDAEASGKTKEEEGGEVHRSQFLKEVMEAMTFPELWMICAGLVLTGIGDNFFYVNLVSFLVSVGYSEDYGAQALSTVGTVGLIGKALLGIGGDYVPIPCIFVLVTTSLMSCALMGCLLVIKSIAAMYVLAVGQSIDRTGSYKGAIYGLLGLYLCAASLLTLAPCYQRVFARERYVMMEIHEQRRVRCGKRRSPDS